MSKKIFIVGAGSSLREFNFLRLRDKDTIAVNMSALDVPNPTYCVTADSAIFRKIQEGFFKSIKTTWVLVTNPNHCTMKWRNGVFKNIKTNFVHDLFCVNMVIRNAGVEGIGFSFNDFKTGYNSGFCALQLAFLLGYEKIYLLGFDMRGGHYHDRYGKDKKIGNKTFAKFYDNFVTALSVLKKRTSVEVVSCSNVSRLNDVIPYTSFERVCQNV